MQEYWALSIYPLLFSSTKSWLSKASLEGASAGNSKDLTSHSTVLTSSPRPVCLTHCLPCLSLAWHCLPDPSLWGCSCTAGCYSWPQGSILLLDFSCLFCLGSAVKFLWSFSWCNWLKAPSSFFLFPCPFYPVLYSLISERLLWAPCWAWHCSHTSHLLQCWWSHGRLQRGVRAVFMPPLPWCCILAQQRGQGMAPLHWTEGRPCSILHRMGFLGAVGQSRWVPFVFSAKSTQSQAGRWIVMY